MDDGPSRKNQGLWELVNRFVSGRRKITEEEIHELMDAGEEEGLINEEENEMIRAIFTLRDTVVREIMVPRTDMACISVDATVREIISQIIGCGHSRIPVFDGTVDNIVGLAYAKDLLKYWGMNDAAIVLRKIMRPPYFIPEAKNLEELLQEFRKKRVHIAIVIDEYGGTSGLVTIEDLLEQIVGDIQDEYDLEEEWLVEEPEGSVLVDARLPIEELEEYFDIQIEREKFDTVGGLIFHLTGKIPKAGEEVSNHSIVMTVLQADERKISKVRIRRLERREEGVQ
ncbi:hemolysin family protein [Geobacter sp. DSM 9736]|uniref:hemolysin family protein n=1 Tax=Geobacter sp. DSM 9736 TaxID=1277350 RepID=UPI000B50A340|nr:hemolysin family protein [Geobacter sp. DSM 9736]SNB44996.1 CBS domain-containing protein [Geobacter sp. DSM 9736]